MEGGEVGIIIRRNETEGNPMRFNMRIIRTWFYTVRIDLVARKKMLQEKKGEIVEQWLEAALMMWNRMRM